MIIYQIIFLFISLFFIGPFSYAVEPNHQKAVPISQPSKLVKININQANLTELQKIPGITPAKAKSIIAYRKKQGNFKSLEGLQSVPGFKRIKAEKREAIKNYLTI